MKLEKKHWAMLIAGVVILFLVYWFFFRKKKSESGYDSDILIYGNDSSYDPAYPMLGESGYVAGGKCFTEMCPCDISNNKCTCDTKLVQVPCGNVVNSPWKLSGSGKVVKVPGKTVGTSLATAGKMSAGAGSMASMASRQESSYLACHYTCDKVTACTQYNAAGNCTQWASMCNCKGKLMPMEQTGFGNQ